MAEEIEYIDPIEFAKRYFPEAIFNHITYDPEFYDDDTELYVEQSHDGTLIFFVEAAMSLMDALLYGKVTDEHPPSNRKGVRYTIGQMKVVSKHGRVDLPAGNFPGVKEKISIPFKVEYCDQPIIQAIRQPAYDPIRTAFENSKDNFGFSHKVSDGVDVIFRNIQWAKSPEDVYAIRNSYHCDGSSVYVNLGDEND